MKLSIGELRQMIREAVTNEEGGPGALAAEPDPFADPNKPKQPDLRQFAQNVLKCEELLGDMPKVLGQLANSSQNRKASNLTRKGAGLAYHALNDLKALEAILTIAVKEMRKN